jgi:hypothetical protein
VEKSNLELFSGEKMEAKNERTKSLTTKSKQEQKTLKETKKEFTNLTQKM